MRAYAAGSDPMLDKAIAPLSIISKILQQDIQEQCSYQHACEQLNQLITLDSF